MNFHFYILITLLKIAHTYKPERKIKSISNSNPNKKIEITPARYQIANKKTNHDALANQEAPVDYFPAVEFPTNLMDSTKPFYIGTSPFPKDVKTAFDLITSTSNRNKEDTNYSAIKDEIIKAKENFIYLLKQGTDAELFDDMSMINGTIYQIESPILDFDDPFTNWTTAEESYEDIDYVLGFIKDLDEVLTNVVKIDLNVTNNDLNSTECLSTGQKTLKDDVSVIELNGNSFPFTSMEHKQCNTLFDEFNTSEEPFNAVSYLSGNESDIISHIINMQESSCEIGKTVNETSSCADVWPTIGNV